MERVPSQHGSSGTPSSPALSARRLAQAGDSIVYINGVAFDAAPSLVASALMGGATFDRPSAGELAEVVSGTPNGILLAPEPGSSAALAQDSAVQDLVGRPTSPALRRRPPRKRFRIFIDEKYNDSYELHVGPIVPDVNYDVTFRTFQIRRLERERTGTYRRSNFFKVFSSILILFLCGALLAYWSVLSSVQQHVIGVTIIVICVPISILLIWVVSIRFRGIIVVLVMSMVAFFLISWTYRDPDDPNYAQALTVLFITFICVFAVVVLFYLSFYVIWPKLVLSDLKELQVSIKETWSIRPAVGATGKQTGFYQYSTYDTGWRPKTRHFSYRGEVNELKQPHGIGEWFDDSYTGECVRGWFENGKPVGPFVSREYGTSNQFAAVRLMFWRNVEDPWDHNWTFGNSRNKRGPAWGTVRGECSVGGSFFSMYPHAEQLIPPTFPEDDPDIVGKCLKSVLTGLPPLPRGVKREALIILHGMNSPLAYACGTYSQLMAYAKFPTHIIVPIMFSWPGGTLLNYKSAKRVAEDPAWREDFRTFIRTLNEEHGIEIFHIMCHSMGARVVINMSAVFPEIFSEVGEDGEHPDFRLPPTTDPRYYKRTLSSMDLSERRHSVFAPHPDYLDEPAGTMPRQGTLPHPATQRKPRLMSITFLNGEGDIAKFREMFPVMRSVCPIITAYGDEDDWALLFSEMLNGGKEKMLGRYLETLYVEPEDYQRLKSYFSEANPDEEIGEADDEGDADSPVRLFGNETDEPEHFDEEEEHDLGDDSAAVREPDGLAIAGVERLRGIGGDSTLIQLDPVVPLSNVKHTTGTLQPVFPSRRASTATQESLKALGRHQTYLRRQRRHYYDMDVVSTEFLQTNVQALRHVYFVS